MYSLKDDPSIIIKDADKGPVVVVWNCEDYLKEAYRQFDDKEVYEQVPHNPSVLANTLIKALKNIPLRGDLSKDTLGHFLVKDPKFGRFYLLPKIRKRLHDVPGRPVILNCSYYTENISSFLDYHLQPIAQKVMKSYIKGTNHFLSKLKSSGKLPQGAPLCTINVVGVCPNISQSEGLTSFRRFLELRDNEQISSDALIELAEIVLKKNIFDFDKKTFKQVTGTAIGTKFATLYAIFLWLS